MPHLPERGGGSGNDTRLSLGKGAIALPKVLYFTVSFSAASPRLRAPAPYKRQSLTGVQILGGVRGVLLGMPMCTVIYGSFRVVGLISWIVACFPTEEKQMAREGPQKLSGRQSVFSGSTKPKK